MLGIAAEFLFDDWKAVWNLPENKGLRDKRPDPSVLLPGDVVFLPDPKPLVFTLPTGQHHRLVVKRPKVQIRPQVLHMDATPVAAAKYTVTPSTKPSEGQTDGDGWIEQRIPSGSLKLVLTVQLSDDPEGPTFDWRLAIGGLDPVDTPSGLRQRLSNLGYWPVGETRNEALPYCLRAFQEDHDLDITGEADQATSDKLKEVHAGI
jgi:N-acetylmuramoyl-L-alanine amidase